MPSLHTPAGARRGAQPSADASTCGHFQLDGPHRLVVHGRHRGAGCSPPEYMYPIERATRSGLVGPWRTPDIGELLRRPESRRHRAVGHQQLPDLPEPGDPDLPRLVPALPVLADLAQHPPASRRYNAISPGARPCAERIEHEVAAVVLKEFALQDAGMLGRDSGGVGVRRRRRVPGQRPGDSGSPPAQGGRRLGRTVQARDRTGESVVTMRNRTATGPVRGAGTVRRNLVPGNRDGTLGAAAGELRCRRCRRSTTPSSRAGRGHRLLRQVPPRRPARGCAEPAAPDLFAGDGRRWPIEIIAPTRARGRRRRGA